MSDFETIREAIKPNLWPEGEAAIDRIEAEVEQLRAALERIRDYDPEKELGEPLDEWVEANAFNNVKAIARAALGEEA